MGHKAIEIAGGIRSITVSRVCCRLSMSRQNYYRQRKLRQRRAVDEQLVVELVQAERSSQPRLGTRKLYVLLKVKFRENGIDVGRDRLFEILRKREMLIERRSYRPRTTDARHSFRVYSNELKDREIKSVHEAWVGDLTYIRTDEGFLYLSLLMDVYSRKIVGYNAGDTLEAEGCVRSLRRAFGQLPKGRAPIHHTDRGTQYCCGRYVRKLKRRGLVISMTEENHCYENSMAERLNGILKGEYLLESFRTKSQARRAIDEAVRSYNERRPHASLSYRIPSEVHAEAA